LLYLNFPPKKTCSNICKVAIFIWCITTAPKWYSASWWFQPTRFEPKYAPSEMGSFPLEFHEILVGEIQTFDLQPLSKPPPTDLVQKNVSQEWHFSAVRRLNLWAERQPLKREWRVFDMWKPGRILAVNYWKRLIANINKKIFFPRVPRCITYPSKTTQKILKAYLDTVSFWWTSSTTFPSGILVWREPPPKP